MVSVRAALFAMWALSTVLFSLCSSPGFMVQWNAETCGKIVGFVRHLLECRNSIVGMNLVIVHNSSTLLAEGFGYSNIERSVNVTNTTRFGIASVTKSFTTALLSRLLYLAKFSETPRNFSWDTPVREILGPSFYFNTGLLSKTMTLKDLASHRTGLPGNNYVRLFYPDRYNISERIRHLKHRHAVPNDFTYNNLMYSILSLVSETIHFLTQDTDETWEEIMEAQIFNLLDMTNTTFVHLAGSSYLESYDVEEMVYNNETGEEIRKKVTKYRPAVVYDDPTIATPYLKDDSGNWKEVDMKLHAWWSRSGGSGSILSNAVDMGKYMSAQLADGFNRKNRSVLPKFELPVTKQPCQVVPESTRSRQWKRPLLPVTYDSQKYALGWRVGHYRGISQTLHTGTSWGYGALLTLIEDAGLGIHTSISGTDDGYEIRRLIHMYVIDLLLGEEQWITSPSACNFGGAGPEKRREPQGPFLHSFRPIQSWTKFYGRYSNYAYGTLEVYNSSSDCSDQERAKGRKKRVRPKCTLMMRLGEIGLWRLFAFHRSLKKGLVLYGRGQGAMWPRDLPEVEFRLDQDTIVSVTIPTFEPSDPPLFQRDLDLNNPSAPPDIDDCGPDPAAEDSCGQLQPAVHSTLVAAAVSLLNAL